MGYARKLSDLPINKISLKTKLLYGGIALIILVFCVAISVEVDTSYLYSATDHIIKGDRMYADFAYHQFPFSAYFYTPFFHIFGISILTGRVVNIALGMILYLLLVCLAEYLIHDEKSAWKWITLLWVVNLEVLGKFAWVGSKEVLSATLLVAVIYVIAKYGEKWSGSILAGILGAFLILTKLVYLPWCIFAAIAIFSMSRNFLKILVMGIISIGVSGLILYYFYYGSPEAFIFLTSYGLIACKKAGFPSEEFLFGFIHIKALFKAVNIFLCDYAFLLIPVVLLVVLRKIRPILSRRKRIILCLVYLCILWNGIYGFLFTVRSHPHYLMTTVPLMVLLAAVFFSYIDMKVAIPRSVLVVVSLFIAWNQFLFFSNYYSGTPFYRHFLSGEVALFNYERERNLLREDLNKYTDIDSKGIALRYGQAIYGSGRSLLDGYELTTNFFKVEIPLAEADKYHVVTKEKLIQDIINKKAAFIFVNDSEIKLLNNILKQSDHQPIAYYGYKSARKYVYNELYVLQK